jgi:hypothetical protein
VVLRVSSKMARFHSAYSAGGVSREAAMRLRWNGEGERDHHFVKELG